MKLASCFSILASLVVVACAPSELPPAGDEYCDAPQREEVSSAIRNRVTELGDEIRDTGLREIDRNMGQRIFEFGQQMESSVSSTDSRAMRQAISSYILYIREVNTQQMNNQNASSDDTAGTLFDQLNVGMSGFGAWLPICYIVEGRSSRFFSCDRYNERVRSFLRSEDRPGDDVCDVFWSIAIRS